MEGAESGKELALTAMRQVEAAAVHVPDFDREYWRRSNIQKGSLSSIFRLRWMTGPCGFLPAIEFSTTTHEAPSREEFGTTPA